MSILQLRNNCNVYIMLNLVFSFSGRALNQPIMLVVGADFYYILAILITASSVGVDCIVYS